MRRLAWRTVSTLTVFGLLIIAPARAADPEMDKLLRGPVGKDWVTNGGNLTNNRYSTLKQIDTTNVGKLKGAWMTRLKGSGVGGKYSFEASPLVKDGIMYVVTGNDDVFALNAKTGAIIWEYWSGIDQTISTVCCGWANRGLAMGEGQIYLGQLDANVVALDMKTGKVAWKTPIEKWQNGYGITSAPLYYDGMVYSGITGGEFGIRGYIEATDLNTGKAAWRTYTIPGTGEPGNETWKDGKERWKHGGGSVWETATYDPESDTFYQGVGNAGPDWDAEYRPGDNKWAASVLAISPADGKIKWGYQYTPNDPYDYDEISEHPIIDAKVNGEDRKLVVHAARNGFFYALDRTNGSFVAGKQYVDQLNWTPGLDPKTGRPLNYDPNAGVQIYAEGSHGTRARPNSDKLCPAHTGGKNWEPSAYNPELGLLYIPSVEGCDYIDTVAQKDFADQGGTVKPRERFSGGGTKIRERLYGSLKAVDPVTGDIKAALKLAYPNYSGALTTAGNLVFIGLPDGTFSAHDARTLQELWSFNAGTGINAPPISYSVNGKQYIAVLAGSRQSQNVIPYSPELKNTSTASMLYVFGL